VFEVLLPDPAQSGRGSHSIRKNNNNNGDCVQSQFELNRLTDWRERGPALGREHGLGPEEIKITQLSGGAKWRVLYKWPEGKWVQVCSYSPDIVVEATKDNDRRLILEEVKGQIITYYQFLVLYHLQAVAKIVLNSSEALDQAQQKCHSLREGIVSLLEYGRVLSLAYVIYSGDHHKPTIENVDTDIPWQTYLESSPSLFDISRISGQNLEEQKKALIEHLNKAAILVTNFDEIRAFTPYLSSSQKEFLGQALNLLQQQRIKAAWLFPEVLPCWEKIVLLPEPFRPFMIVELLEGRLVSISTEPPNEEFWVIENAARALLPLDLSLVTWKGFLNELYDRQNLPTVAGNGSAFFKVAGAKATNPIKLNLEYWVEEFATKSPADILRQLASKANGLQPLSDLTSAKAPAPLRVNGFLITKKSPENTRTLPSQPVRNAERRDLHTSFPYEKSSKIDLYELNLIQLNFALSRDVSRWQVGYSPSPEHTILDLDRKMFSLEPEYLENLPKFMRVKANYDPANYDPATKWRQLIEWLDRRPQTVLWSHPEELAKALAEHNCNRDVNKGKRRTATQKRVPYYVYPWIRSINEALENNLIDKAYIYPSIPLVSEGVKLFLQPYQPLAILVKKINDQGDLRPVILEVWSGTSKNDFLIHNVARAVLGMPAVCFVRGGVPFELWRPDYPSINGRPWGRKLVHDRIPKPRQAVAQIAYALETDSLNHLIFSSI